ncbi:rod shape-determining protein MreD [Phaeobacter sp. NW0010-22]|uniref:rod shape-determining protein MreD n=1 Tax=Phaeobacter sp. NW0010-22 TaxID=3135907 RepID=UPI000EFAB3E9
MDNLGLSRVWWMRFVYLGLAMTLLFFQLLPLETLPRGWAPPDLLVAITFAWMLRRPDYVPLLSIAAALLLTDLLLQRPPGLWAALVVAGCAFLKSRVSGQGEISFVGEWASVGLVLIAITVFNRLILGITAVELTSLWLVFCQLLLTIVVYPIVALISQTLMGVRKLTPADADVLGARA